MRPGSLSLAIPVYNEERLLASTVDSLVRTLEGVVPEFELILVENGSTDSTPRIVDDLAKNDPRIRAVHAERPNYGWALRQGLLMGTGEYLANFSVDWVDVEFLKTGLSEMDRFDIVLGSKMAQGGSDRRSILRRLGGTCFHRLVQLLFGLQVSDTHGIKVMRGSRVSALLEACRFGGEVFDTELIVRAQEAGLALLEVPVDVEEMRPSRVGVLTRAWRGFGELLRLRVAFLLERAGSDEQGRGLLAPARRRDRRRVNGS